MSFCGTKNYMAPEIINKIQYYEKVDIWSFLCVLIELCIMININPILISTNKLTEMIKVTEFEIKLISYMHITNVFERPSAEKVKEYLFKYSRLKV